jgi:hypothetical protein
MANKTAATAGAEKPQKYTKEALAGSKRFQARRDLLNAILDDGKKYTIEEVETKITNYLNKEV